MAVMNHTEIPQVVIGLPVKRIRDTWLVDDEYGSRVYCLVQLEDRREVTLMRLDGAWVVQSVSSYEQTR